MNWHTTDHSTTPEVLLDELRCIFGENKDNTSLGSIPSEKEVVRLLHKSYPRTALCFSGGGIRSAAFGLGVIQWLAHAKLLSSFHYISSVSGGGYIASWLSAWITREPKGYSTVEAKLNQSSGFEKEADEIRHLRENTKYITQRAGIFSGDTWAAISISLRNMLLNWFVIVPFMGAATVIPQIVAATIYENKNNSFVWFICFILFIIFYTYSTQYLVGNTPRWSVNNRGRKAFAVQCQLPYFCSAILWMYIVLSGGADFTFIQIIIAYLVVNLVAVSVAYAVSLFVWAYCHDTPWITVSGGQRVSKTSGDVLAYNVSISCSPKSAVTCEALTEDRQAVATIHYIDTNLKISFQPNNYEPVRLEVPLISDHPAYKLIEPSNIRILIRNIQGGMVGSKPDTAERSIEILGFAFGAAFSAALLGSAHFIAAQLLTSSPKFLECMIFITLGVPIFFGALFCGLAVLVGVMSRIPRSEEDREWLGRAGGLFLYLGFGWIIINTIILLMPYIPYRSFFLLQSREAVSSVITAIGVCSGLTAALIGQSSRTPASHPGTSSVYKYLLPILVMVFIATLVTETVYLINKITLGGRLSSAYIADVDMAAYWPASLKLLISSIILAFVGTISAIVINVNRFSLHSMYRNRLVRAFLGASTPTDRRHRLNAFTRFTDADNLELQRLWERSSGPSKKATWRPFNLINMTLNVGAGSNLAQQERKALPFVASPLWCGSGSTSLDAYRRASEYGGESRTITVGTAMAISGAAVSPNMGYNSSPLLAIILTLFNVRLGWWLGNPSNKISYKHEGPKFGLKSLIQESFGLTKQDTPYVYLSDGGHFENLGLYEVVRRRCHFIMISDAGHDPDFLFEDLANATRRIAIDFGIPIDFPYLTRIRKRSVNSGLTIVDGVGYAVGTIDYRAKDGEDAKQGVILYIKPTFKGDEPADIIGYANKNLAFPHDSTQNQWFTEEQFESYRSLSYWIMSKLYSQAGKYSDQQLQSTGDKPMQIMDLERFFLAMKADLRENRT